MTILEEYIALRYSRRRGFGNKSTKYGTVEMKIS